MMMGEEDQMLKPEENGSSTSFGSDKTRYYKNKDQYTGLVDEEAPSFNCCFIFSLYVLAITAGLLQGY